MRSLYEMTMVLLNIELDTKKRNALFNSIRNDNAKATWKNHFRPFMLSKTLGSFTESLQIEENEIKKDRTFLNEWYEQTYAEFSSFVHNDFFCMFAYASRIPESDDPDAIISPNICGHFATRIEEILMQMNGILFHAGMVFVKALTSAKTDVSKTIICHTDKNDETYKPEDCWNTAMLFELINREIFMAILYEKEKGNLPDNYDLRIVSQTTDPIPPFFNL